MTVASNPKRFFHAVREIERDVLHTDRVYAHQQEQRVGYDGNPAHELIRFQGDKTLDFCPVESTEKQLSVNNKQALEVSFFGLFGSQGILPQHYTELMLSRLKQKDTSLVDFLDLFNHRLSSLFYRAWEKHQFPVQYERYHAVNDKTHLFYQLIACLTGTYKDNTESYIAYYAGLYSRYPRNATSLGNLLSDVIEHPVEIVQFAGGWGRLDPTDCSALPTAANPNGQYASLGVDAICGRKAWLPGQTYRIVVGPVDASTFEDLQPSMPLFTLVCNLAREYSGPALKFELELKISPDALNPCYLGGKGSKPSYLSRNSWVGRSNRFKSIKSIVFRSEVTRG